MFEFAHWVLTHQFMAQFLQDFYNSSVKMPKPFLVRGQIKEEVEGTTREPITNGKIFKSADSAVYISSNHYCLLKTKIQWLINFCVC